MKLARLTLLALSLGAATTTIAAPVPAKAKAEAEANDPALFTGLWQNQRGSTLEIKKESSDLLSGVFKTAVARTKGCIGYPAPLKAFYNGNAISMTINMMGCGSPTVIALSGIIMTNKEGKEQLRTQALIQSKGKESWDSQILTTDYYTRVKTPAKTASENQKSKTVNKT